MANIVDTSFFVADIEIPNVNQGSIKTDVENSIKHYEKEVLISLLGYPLWKELMAASYTAGDLSKWDKLVNGEEFSFDLNGETITVYWEGLKGTDKKSLIAYYVYFMHRRKRASYMAGVGTEVKADTENSSTDDIHAKLTYIWNDFVFMYGGNNCEDENGTYESENLASAYNYLVAKKSDFTNWQFISQGGEINIMGV